MAGKKEAKQKAGPRGQTEKNREENGSSTGTKNGFRRSGRRRAQKARQLPQQEQAMEAQEERETVCVGVLHVSSRTGWACHMVECTEPYHALRECGFFRSLSTGESKKSEKIETLRGLSHAWALYMCQKMPFQEGG